MSDLIRRADVLETYADLYWADERINAFKNDLDKVFEDLRSLPSAEPEILRCKDCKWCVEHYDTDGNAPYWICKNWDGGTDADGFCYEAERRTDE